MVHVTLGSVESLTNPFWLHDMKPTDITIISKASVTSDNLYCKLSYNDTVQVLLKSYSNSDIAIQ